jgi:integrase
MAGRPPLKIGTHGKITRTDLGGGRWVARCQYRDSDGITRPVERRTPPGVTDRRGNQAEEELLKALADRRPPGSGDGISGQTLVITLIDTHLARLAADGKATRTLETYRYDAEKFAPFIGKLRVEEATVLRLDAALRGMKERHGHEMTRHAKTLLNGALALAVMAGILPTNPVRDVPSVQGKKKPEGALVMTTEQVRELMSDLQQHPLCIQKDLVDPIVVFAATGMRRGELLGLRWNMFDPKAGTVKIVGKVIRKKGGRANGGGVVWESFPKTDASRRTIALSDDVVAVLKARRRKLFFGDHEMIFPSMAGTWRDPDNFNSDWRRVRDELNVSGTSSHSFRKTLATINDDAGVSPRVVADVLGHANPSMTQDRYMARGRTHSKVADVMQETLDINPE